MWKIEEFTVTTDQAEMDALRAAISFSSRGRYTPAGTYRRLTRNGETIMSDTPDELRDLSTFKWCCAGSVLINGLGLGCAVEIALANRQVTDVTVIEIEQQVIDLVAPSLYDSRVTIHCADAFSWKPPKGVHWNVVWHDIWDDICADNLPEMKRLHRKYGPFAEWQGSWCRAECERQRY